MQNYRTPSHAWGHGSFITLLTDITSMQPAAIKRVCVWLDISYKTMQRYISGEANAPRSVCFALYHESSYGRELGFTEAYNDRQVMSREINDLRAEVRSLTASLKDAQANKNGSTYGAANDSNYGVKPLTRKPHAFTSFKRRTVRRFHN
ncbi:hypothetical protein [Collimonas pratensis]|nr:hypothetical protein [Collimonas pratensis]